MPKTPKLNKASDNKDTLNIAVNAFTDAWEYTQSNYHDTWQTAWKLYNNQRVDRSYEGVSNNFVPMTFSTIETMVAALAGGRPKFDFVPTKPEQDNETKVLNSLLDYYWDSDQWHPKVTKWIRSMLMYGTAVMYVYWDMDKPRLINVPLKDFFVDPKAVDPDHAEYMGRRYLTTEAELKSFTITDPETGVQKPMYTNLQKIKAGGGQTKGEQTDKEDKDIYLGSTLGDKARDQQVEVIEYWTKDRVITVANRSVVIRDEDNPYKMVAQKRGRENPKGIMPFVVQRDYIDESLFYGRGEVEPIQGLQENLNDLTNQYQDAITFQLNPMFTLDPEFADMVDDIESLPGAVYPIPAGALNPLPTGNTSPDAFSERLNIKNEIREATSSDQITKGVNSGTQQTATEIVTQIQQSGERFGLKLNQIENEGYYQLAKTVLEMVQLYVTEPMAVRVAGKDSGIDWQEFNPDEFDGDYEPRVMLDSNNKARMQKDQEATKEMYQAMLDDPLVNQQELRRMGFKKIWGLEEDEIDKLMTPNEVTDFLPELADGEIDPGAIQVGVDPTGISLTQAVGGVNGAASQ